MGFASALPGLGSVARAARRASAGGSALLAAKLLAAALLSLALLPVTARAGDAPAFERHSDLAGQGIIHPISLSGLADEATFRFPVPVGALDAALVLHLTVDLASARTGSLAILVNDQARQTLALAPKRETATVELPLQPADIATGAVAVTLRYRAALSEDACIDQRVAAAFVAVAPGSGVVAHLPAQPTDSLAAAWAALPARVTLALPALTLTPNQFGAALDLMMALKRDGHSVALTRLPKVGDALALDAIDARAWTAMTDAPPPASLTDGDAVGRLIAVKALTAAEPSHVDRPPLADIVLASAGELDSLANAAGRMLRAAPEAVIGDLKSAGTPLAPRADTGGRNLGLRRIADRTVIALTGEDAARAAVEFLDSAALPLGQAPTLTVTGVRLPATAPADGEVALTDLIVGGPRRMLADRATFEATLAARDMPPGYEADGLAIDIVAPNPADEPAPLLHVFVNDMLVRTVRLGDSDQSQRVRVDFPNGLIGMENQIRIVVQRRLTAAGCAVAAPAYPVQILPSSMVLGRTAHGPLTDFYQLPAQLRTGMDLIISPQMLGNPEPVLDFVSTLLLRLLPPGHKPSIITSTQTTVPARPFVNLVPEVKTTGGPVAIDGDRLRVVAANGASLIDIAGVPATAALELVEAGKQPGLQVLQLASGGWPKPPTIALDRGNVALVDASGVSLALTTHRDRLFRLNQSDATYYWQLVDRYRYYLIGGGWAVATLFFLVGLRGILRRRGQP